MREGASIFKPSDASPIHLIRFPAANERLPLLGLSVFMAFLYLRPADLFPVLAPLRPVLVVLALTVLIFFLTKKGTREITFAAYPTGKFLLAFLCVMVLSIPFSYWPGESFSNTTEFLKEVTVFILIVNIASSLAALSRLTGVIIFSSAVLALFAVKDYLAGRLLYSGRIEGVVGGIFGDPNDLAVCFVTVLPLIYWRLQARPAPNRRLLLLGAMVLAVGGVIATQSRGGFLGLLAVAGLIWMRSRQKLAAVVLAAALGITVVLISPQGAFERFSTIAHYQNEENAQIRLNLWRAGLRMFADHPVLGVGAGVFPIAYGKDYRDPEMPYNTWWTAHNSVIEVMAELGLAGLVVWIGLIASGFSILRKARRRLSSADQDSVFFEALELNSALSVSFVGFLVSSLFLSKAYDWILIILLAMITASFRMMQGRSPGPAGGERSRFTGNHLRASGPGLLRKSTAPLKEQVP
jgi:putative inorganic carbon (HCO3(-)) transporter